LLYINPLHNKKKKKKKKHTHTRTATFANMATIMQRSSSLDSNDLVQLDSMGEKVAEYEKLGRRKLQKLAKAKGIQANLASAEIIK
jgi:hypothetical protein